MFGYIPLGIAFGLVLVKAGYPWWMAPIMSLFIYSGAAQFMAVGLFAANASLSSILITIAILSIRHSVYSLSLISRYKNTGIWKPYLIFAVTDETFSLITTTKIPEGMKAGTYYGLLTGMDQFYWLAGGIIGSLAGYAIPFDLTGIDFSLTALFAVMTVEQFLSTKDYFTLLITALCTICSIVLWRLGFSGDASNILLIAFAFSLSLILIFRRSSKNEKNPEAEK